MADLVHRLGWKPDSISCPAVIPRFVPFTRLMGHINLENYLFLSLFGVIHCDVWWVLYRYSPLKCDNSIFCSPVFRMKNDSTCVVIRMTWSEALHNENCFVQAGGEQGIEIRPQVGFVCCSPDFRLADHETHNWFQAPENSHFRTIPDSNLVQAADVWTWARNLSSPVCSFLSSRSAARDKQNVATTLGEGHQTANNCCGRRIGSPTCGSSFHSFSPSLFHE